MEDIGFVDDLLGKVLLDIDGDLSERVEQLVELYVDSDARARQSLSRLLTSKADLRTALGLYLEGNRGGVIILLFLLMILFLCYNVCLQ